MRKSTAALSALALSAFVLTGCSSAPTFDGVACDRDSSATLASSVQVSGDIGAPAASLEAQVRTGHMTYTDLIVGDGRAISSDAQSAIMTRVLLNGDTGAQIHAAVNLWSPESADAELPGVDKALECATAGSRVAVALPAKDLPEGMAAQVGIGDNGSLVAIYDIQYTLRPKAEGRDVFNDARGLPTVVRAPDGRPGIIIPDSAAPEKAVVQTLIEGDGETVADGTPLFLHTAVRWADRSVAGTTWDSGPIFDTSKLPEDALKAISEATVGSQLLVVVPGEGGDATAYVIDVLGIVPAELLQK
ncbi:FKBP-type peptidyl-prolyl cis-trans isomerases 1 [Microbacterium esteraromaticum]|uniref:FKBP-type peptidyl-prolyl cis-trans isomerases 1 n=1 Tax=Microbacterium esteraromaticum TaxID=57043 RepID=A0A1R4IQW3_9MICO|nr:hypothetical protein [Microbacterium esteraromaticum]SJN22118.1 FKBP-type peptidyl-prolyl cis-trans isomerases 1 [Microbacterium esteraromaticum]